MAEIRTLVDSVIGEVSSIQSIYATGSQVVWIFILITTVRCRENEEGTDICSNRSFIYDFFRSLLPPISYCFNCLESVVLLIHELCISCFPNNWHMRDGFLASR
jgi:hypothetical protein